MEQIRLAREGNFALGDVMVRPGTRELARNGEVQVVEPRVMQVLVALAQAGGAIVGRDELIRLCWNGRIVGEDAINRVMSRLRRTAHDIGGDRFRIETITKVGYRLVTSDDATGLPENSTSMHAAMLAGGSRRGLLIGGALAIGALAVGSGAWSVISSEQRPAKPTPLSARLLDQALMAFCQGTRAGQEDAIGALRYAVAEQPDFADGWGALAMTYSLSAPTRPASEGRMFRERSRAAAERAEGIVPNNSYAAVARSFIEPMRGNWMTMHRTLQQAVASHPSQDWLLLVHGLLYANVGRSKDATTLFARLRRQHSEHSPALYVNEIFAAWSANRLEEADRLLENAAQLFPGHVGIWFTQYTLLLYTGRATQSLAMLEDGERLPASLAASDIDALASAARAMHSRTDNDVDAAMAIWLPKAASDLRDCRTAAQLAAALGRIDDAFRLLRTFYFDRRYPAGASPTAQSEQPLLTDRFTDFLFHPAMTPARADPRFAALTRDLGLDAYWQQSSTQPDFRRSG